MTVTVTGGSGFVGRRLVAALIEAGYSVRLVGRAAPASPPPGITFTGWASASTPFPAEALEGADAVIHLAGEPVAQRWNDEVKRKIRESRVEGTKRLAEALAGLEGKPEALLCASATGFYGNRGDEILTERSARGNDFLADVCVEWERAADRAQDAGVRVVKMRIGLVLGREGGGLEKMLPPFRAGVGGKLGSGRQWMSWIHLDDLVALFLFALTTRTVHGAVNGVSPEPIQNAEFTKVLAAALHRPAAFSVPLFALKALYGEMASVVVASSRAIPEVALAAGFGFRYTDLGAALRACLESGSSPPAR